MSIFSFPLWEENSLPAQRQYARDGDFARREHAINTNVSDLRPFLTL